MSKSAGAAGLAAVLASASSPLPGHREEIAVAWASHTNLGDYTAAALEWLEHCGRPSFYNLQQRLAAQEPAALSPVRSAAAEDVLKPWRACQRRGGGAAKLESRGAGAPQGTLMSSSAARRWGGGALAALAAAGAAAAIVG